MSKSVLTVSQGNVGGFAEADVRALVRLLGETAVIRGGLLERKVYLLDGLCEFSGAQEWRWMVVTPDGICRAAITRAFNGTFPPVDVPEMTERLPKSFTSRHERAASERMIISQRRLFSGQEESRLMLVRDRTERAFSERETALVRLVLDHVPWLHAMEWTRRQQDSEPDRLSPRQQHVLNLLLLGLSRKEIAAQMDISINTVAGYIREIYATFGVKTHAELMRVCHETSTSLVNRAA